MPNPNPTWHEQLEGSLQGHESLAGDTLNDFAKGHISALEDFAKLKGEHDTLRGELDSRVRIPGEKATDEERAKYRKATGVPDTVEGYGIKRPENLPEGVDFDAAWLAKTAHELGLSKAATEKLAAKQSERILQVLEDNKVASEKAVKEASEKLRGEWGQHFEKNAELAKRAAKAFGGEELVSFLEAVGLANDPLMLKTFHTIGDKLAEDTAMLPKGGGGGHDGPLTEEEKAAIMYPEMVKKG